MEQPPRPTLESVTTIRDDGSRRFLFPADVRGIFTIGRRVSGLFLIAFYLSLPWIKIGGYPAVFLDIANRRFHLFGFTLAAQDAWLLFFLITGLGFLLFFLTALVGRVWCGWACPQTVFLDHVYRPIERWIDGDAVQRRALDAAPWTAGKALRLWAEQGADRPATDQAAIIARDLCERISDAKTDAALKVITGDKLVIDQRAWLAKKRPELAQQVNDAVATMLSMFDGADGADDAPSIPGSDVAQGVAA